MSQVEKGEKKENSFSHRKHTCDLDVILMRRKALCWQTAKILYHVHSRVLIPPNQPLSPHGTKKKAWQKIATKELMRKEKESSVEKWKGPLWMMMGRASWHVPCSSSGSWWTLTSGAVPGRGSEEEMKSGLAMLGVSLSSCGWPAWAGPGGAAEGGSVTWGAHEQALSQE